MAQEPQVLVIDDETGSRESMALAIQRAGFVVRTFDDARRALELLEETDTPQLAVCDLRMPGLDGLGFLNEVRKRGLDLAVILVDRFRLDRVRRRGDAGRRRRLPDQAGRSL